MSPSAPVRALAGALAGVASFLLVERVARADALEAVGSELHEVEGQARALDAVVAEAPRAREVGAEHRLANAQALLAEKDYTRAAFLLMDVVERYPDSAVYPEALFYLAESLYQLGDLQTARIYLLKVVEKPGSKAYQLALLRLVELALRTEDYSNVDDYLAKLAAVPPGQVEPSVPYVRGKYQYFSGQLDAALASFAEIRVGNTYHMHARYFSGVCQVAKASKTGNFDDAQKTFLEVLKLAAKTDGEKRIHELAQLALARIHYEKGEAQQAISRYQNIARTSDLFDAAFYEIAWVYIKDNQFKKALGALDLMLLAAPDSPLAPEVQILEGNLLIRLGDFGKATELFARTRDHYDPIWRDLDAKMAQQKNPAAYVNALLGESLQATEIAVLPKLAVSWAREEKQLVTLVGILSSLRDIEQSLAEADRLLTSLDRGIDGPARARIFPDLAIGRGRSLEVENRLVALRDRLGQITRDIVSGKASGAEMQELASIADERKAVEEEIRKLPKSSEAYETRAGAARDDFDGVDRKVSELNVLVEGLRAELVAMEKYFADTNAGKKAEEEAFRRQANEVHALIEDVQKVMAAIRQDVSDIKLAVGIGDSQSRHEDERKRRYAEILTREHALIARLAARLGPAEQARVQRAGVLVQRATAVQAIVDDFNIQLDGKIEERLTDIRRLLDEEKRSQIEYRDAQKQFTGEAKVVGAEAAEAGFKGVLHRFYSIVVQSDVGIIDVAWALKQEKTDAVTKLVKDQKGELKSLDQEFSEVLQESQ